MRCEALDVDRVVRFFMARPDVFEATVLCGLNADNVMMALVNHGLSPMADSRTMRAILAALGAEARRRWPLAAPAPRPVLIGTADEVSCPPGPMGLTYEARPFLVACGQDIARYEADRERDSAPKRERWPAPYGWDVVETDCP